MIIFSNIQKSCVYNKVRNLFFQYIMAPIAYRITSKFKILNSLDSIRYILDHRCSVSRYGDGEFYVMMGKGNGFQTPNPLLAQRLKDVIMANDVSNHMIGIPISIKDVSGLTEGFPLLFWKLYTGRHIFFINRYLKKERLYLDSLLSRFFHEVRDKSRCGEQIKLLKRIWQGQKLMIVEGDKTRSGIGNDLYDNAQRVRRILCPATNAFDRYNEILCSIQEHTEKDELILLSLGMTATVLAYDLAKLGYWAIDMGHLDVEYEWYLKNADYPMPIEGKFTNEAMGGDIVGECIDPQYLKQIVCNV